MKRLASIGLLGVLLAACSGNGLVGDVCDSDNDCESGLMCGPAGACVIEDPTLDGLPCVTALDCPSGDLCDVGSGNCFVPLVVSGVTTGQPCVIDGDCAVAEYCTDLLVCAVLPLPLVDRPSCDVAADCGLGEICAADNACAVFLDTACAVDADCPGDTICDLGGALVCYFP